MPRYTLRTLLILLAVGPMVLAGVWFARYMLPLTLIVVYFFLAFALVCGFIAPVIISAVQYILDQNKTE